VRGLLALLCLLLPVPSPYFLPLASWERRAPRERDASLRTGGFYWWVVVDKGGAILDVAGGEMRERSVDSSDGMGL
jgi:hypothetical protein